MRLSIYRLSFFLSPFCFSNILQCKNTGSNMFFVETQHTHRGAAQTFTCIRMCERQTHECLPPLLFCLFLLTPLTHFHLSDACSSSPPLSSFSPDTLPAPGDLRLHSPSPILHMHARALLFLFSNPSLPHNFACYGYTLAHREPQQQEWIEYECDIKLSVCQTDWLIVSVFVYRAIGRLVGCLPFDWVTVYINSLL